MNLNTLWILKTGFQAIAGLFTVFIAILVFLDTLHDEKQEPVKDWFKRKWIIIKDSRWLTLPDHVTIWLLKTSPRFQRIVLWVMAKTKLSTIAIISLLPLFFIAWWIHFGVFPAILATLIFVPTLTAVPRIAEKKRRTHLDYFFLIPNFLLLYSIPFLWLVTLLNIKILYAFLILFLFLPFNSIILGLPFSILSNTIPKLRPQTPHLILSSVMTASFGLTFFAFLLGQLTDPIA